MAIIHSKAELVNRTGKLFFLLLFLCFPTFLPAQSTSSNILEKRFDYSCDGLPLAEILIELSVLSNTSIAFDAGKLKAAKRSIQAQQEPLRVIIKKALVGTNLDFKLAGGVILLSKKKKTIILSGYIEDQASGERLVAATIYEKNSRKGVVTNDYGFFSLTIPEGKIDLEISYLGFQALTDKLELKQSTSQIYALTPSLTFEPVEVVEKRLLSGAGKNFELETTTIDGAIINALPALAGEADIIRYLQSQSGITTGTDGIGGLHVRGGGVDQNLILLDGVPIFNPSHALGLFSIFNPATIKSASFQRSGFSARYGGNLSSVLDIRSKEGNVKKFHSEIEISTIATKAAVEVPLWKERGGLMLAARRSHLDPLIKTRSRGMRQIEDFEFTSIGELNFNFYDFNAKLNYKLTDKDRVYLSFYKGRDKFSDYDSWAWEGDGIDFPLIEGLQDFTYINWGNVISSLRWNHLYGNRLFSNATFTISRFDYQSFLTENYESTYPDMSIISDFFSSFSTNILDYRFKLDYDYYLNSKHKLIWGASFLRRVFEPGSVSEDYSFLEDVPSSDAIDDFFNDYEYEFPEVFPVTEIDIYLEDQFQINSKTKLSFGLHQALYFGYDATYFSLQPRLNFNWSFAPDWQFHFGGSRMSQFLHLLTSTDAGLPSDLWVPATDSVGAQHAWEGSLGVGGKLAKNWHFKIEGYYKRMDHVLAYSTDENLPTLAAKDPVSWQEEVEIGKGQAYGIETGLTYKSAKFLTNINYTYSRSFRRFDNINGGEAFPFRYDRPHSLNLNVQFTLNRHWQLQAHWQFNSGQPITLLETDFYSPINVEIPFDPAIQKSSINGFRLKNYHRLDANLNFRFGGGKNKHQLTLGAYNAYNRRNPIYTYLLSEDLLFPDEDAEKSELGLGIIPTIGYKWSFN